MSSTVIRTPEARRDLSQLADHIARDSLDSALRFLDAAEAAFELLASNPELGTRCSFRSPEADELRVWSIRRFQRFAIFYRTLDDGIEVVRVIHGARDIDAIFSGRPKT